MTLADIFWATIFLLCFVVLTGIVMYVSRKVEHGEARFDKDGKTLDEIKPLPPTDTEPAKRIGED